MLSTSKSEPTRQLFRLSTFFLSRCGPPAGLDQALWTVRGWRECTSEGGVSMSVRAHLSCPLACDWPAMASMMASCEYMLIGVLYWAWTMVAFPPGPLTSMGLWVDKAESFRAMGLKLGKYSILLVSGWGVRCQWGIKRGSQAGGESEHLGIWEI